jgi:hypothetical protein
VTGSGSRLYTNGSDWHVQSATVFSARVTCTMTTTTAARNVLLSPHERQDAADCEIAQSLHTTCRPSITIVPYARG